MLRALIHDGKSHIPAQLLVGLLGQILWIHDCALRADPPVPIGIDETQAVWIAGHERLDVFWHRLGVQLEILGKHTPPVTIATPRLELARRRSKQSLLEHWTPGNGSGALERAADQALREPEHGDEANWAAEGT